ncbi:MAG: DNA mismatch repair endonuclease MutL [Treponema sp.]|nr:DNA mismatch repair endonuclease MutL [Treponema sp.]
MIKQLSADVARKIAAGEVIDRPNAIIRELLDNAVDSQAKTITVEIIGGGIESIRVIDDGCGINKDDLSRCARPHATSKISSESDLLNLTTLGFRGEALASIAAVSRLSITSGMYRMRASITEDHIIETCQPISGTIVQAQALFENFPARRLFLKRPASETVMCRSTFIEKALPRPDIAFRLTVDSSIKLDLPANQTPIQRFVQALSFTENESLFYKLDGKGYDFSFYIILGEPSVHRNDKKNIYIFTNGRRITEYSLMQAIEYGCQGFFPNGTHPVAALFVTMDPSHVDFNIHPAKKEARFQDISELHHAVSSTIRDFFRNYTIKAAAGLAEQALQNDSEEPQFFAEERLTNTTNKQSQQPFIAQVSDLRSQFFSPSSAPQVHETTYESIKKYPSYSISHTPMQTAPISDILASPAPIDQTTSAHSTKYIGSTLGVFLLAEKENTLYIIDQHAAHERILYNKILASQGNRQQLLVPYVIETSSKADDDYLESIQQQLENIGFSCKNCGNGTWEFTTVPERWKGSEYELQRSLLDKHLEPEELLSSIAAMTACKAAIKDGYVLDDESAAELAEQALLLPDPHCPHGRPIFTAITKEHLFELVRRTEG